MNFNLVTNIENCFNLVREVPLDLVYYSHIPTAIAAIVIGVFVLFKNKSLASKLLFSLAVIFSLWSFIDLLLWTSYDSRVYMFFWAIEYTLEILLFVVSLYFVYAFVDKKDASLKLKLIWGFMVAPVIILTSTKYTLINFDGVQCIPTEGLLWKNYILPLEILFYFWIIIFSILRYRKASREGKSQIILLMLGVGLFLGIFAAFGYVILLMDYNYKYELFGLIGLPVFLGFLAYLIVKYKAFNIKLLGTQALVILLIFLIGALLFYVQETGGKILIVINLALALFFGWLLVKSVKLEVQQREALEVANKEISERKDQLQKMADSLAIANDKLKQLDQAKTDFINVASHQLKHAPTPIKGYLSLILNGSYGEVPEKLTKPLKNIDIANERQILLVNDLLAVARMESGKVQLDFQKQRIEDICQGVYDNLAVTAKEKNLAFEYAKPQQPLPELILDKGKIFEAIFNFVDNAVKYTTSGSVTLKVEFAQLSDYKPRTDMSDQKPVITGSVVRVTVSDTGSGISQENIPYLFAKFSRKDVAKVNADGTGLGLYVVKLMIEAHGGRTWAESDGEDKGSRFIIEIPVEQPMEIKANNS